MGQALTYDRDDRDKLPAPPSIAALPVIVETWNASYAKGVINLNHWAIVRFSRETRESPYGNSEPIPGRAVLSCLMDQQHQYNGDDFLRSHGLENILNHLQPLEHHYEMNRL